MSWEDDTDDDWRHAPRFTPWRLDDERLQTLMAAIAAGDGQQFLDIAKRFESEDAWRALLQRIAQLEDTVAPLISEVFDAFWTVGRLPLRTTNDVLDALPKLFPPYRGPALRLYRGCKAEEASSRVFGPSWSMHAKPCRWYARYEITAGGGVIISAMVPAKAIITSALLGRCSHHQEILVDHRKMRGVRVDIVRRYSTREVRLYRRFRETRELMITRRIEAAEEAEKYWCPDEDDDNLLVF